MRTSILFLLATLSAEAASIHLPTQAPVRFIVLGDAGTGTSGQYAVAAAMEKVCSQRGCQFALNLGDNFYEYGVDSNTDPQFQTKFEKPYTRLNFPFFMVLGNHDQSGMIPGSGVHPGKGDFQVEYTQHSDKWMMPSRYYNFAVPVARPGIEFFVLDSNPLAPQNVPQFDWYRPNKKYDRDQRAWLRKSIAASGAKWTAVVAHHPYRNNGTHGNAGEFEGLGLATGDELKKMYEAEVCGKVDFLLSGHDHSLQWLQPHPGCGARPQFMVSGAGAKSNGPKSADPKKRASHAIWEAYETLGFFWVEASDARLKISAYTVKPDGSARLAFERTIQK